MSNRNSLIIRPVLTANATRNLAPVLFFFYFFFAENAQNVKLKEERSGNLRDMDTLNFARDAYVDARLVLHTRKAFTAVIFADYLAPTVRSKLIQLIK